MPFILGQRWISDTESELGIGIVVALNTRMVTLIFPAINENRLYARDNAPITRVIFNPGDTITTQQGWQLKVEQVQESQGLLIYTGTRLDNLASEVVVWEHQLDSKLTFSKPQDRLFAGQIGHMSHFALRFRARQYQCEQFRLPGLRGMRTSLIPHQLHIAYEVGQRYAPRVLLADEVGLGKTIEAGMIIHQQLLAGRAERILIVVPETLQHQWIVEMLRRFNLHFSLFDDERYVQALLDSRHPFETEQLVICSLGFILTDQTRLTQLTLSHWDLLVVDEAHHLLWRQQASSPQYQAIEQLAHHIPGVLLLTATPEQLGQESHFARLRLLDANRFHSYPDFIQEQQQYHSVAQLVTLLLNDNPLDDAALNALREIMHQQDIESLLTTSHTPGNEGIKARNALVDMLMDRHGTSRVLFRNTRHGVKGFPKRELHAIKLPFPAQYQRAIKVSSLVTNHKNLSECAHKMLYPEQLYQALEGNHATCWQFDPRITWLTGLLLSLRSEKVLVICTQTTTVLSLERILRESEGIHSALFHEGMSIMERDRAAAYFSDSAAGAQVLICSEIGSEGRNFQFAHHLVMFDLPLNPDLLEQRIGRLDRIGQTHPVQIFVPYLEHSAQSLLMHWYHDGMDAFEHTCPTGRTIYEHNYDILLGYLASPETTEGWHDFIHHCRQQHETLKIQLEQGRDRLLERYSQGGEQALALAETIAAQDKSVELVNFTFNLLDIIGINQDDRDGMVVLTPSDHMLFPNFPGIPQDGCTITFDRQQALSREDAEFISWEHPIIRQGLDLVLSGDLGCCAVSWLKNHALPEGTLLLETIYVVEAQGPKNLQLNRFLPPTPVRLLLDEKENNLASQVEFESLHRKLNNIKRILGSKLVKTVQSNIHAMLQIGEALITEQASSLIAQAQQRADEQLSAELTRLTSLKVINPNIRDDELETLTTIRHQILARLSQASWRLDALRLIIVAHH